MKRLRPIRSSRPLLRLAPGLAVVLLFSGCKPERPNIQEARRQAAAVQADKVKQTLDDDTARKRIAGGLDPDAIPADKADVVVAVVGATKITVRDVAREIAKEPPHMQARYASLTKRRALLEQMVQFELLVQAALDKKLDQDPKVRAAYKAALAKVALDAVPRVAPSEVTDADIKAYYDQHPDEFQTLELRRGAMLVTNTEASAKKLRGLIAGAIAEAPLKARQVFGDWVAKRSTDTITRKVKGDLGFVDTNGRNEERRIKPPPGVVPALFKLPEVSAISEPVRIDEERVALVQWTGHKPAVQQTLDAARMAIRGKLLREKNIAAREAFIAQLVAKANIKYADGALAAMKSEPNSDGDKADEKGAGAAGVTSTTGRRIIKPNDTSALRRHMKKSRLGGATTRPAPTSAKPNANAGTKTNTSPRIDPKKVQEAIQERKRKAEQKRENLSLPPGK